MDGRVFASDVHLCLERRAHPHGAPFHGWSPARGGVRLFFPAENPLPVGSREITAITDGPLVRDATPTS